MEIMDIYGHVDLFLPFCQVKKILTSILVGPCIMQHLSHNLLCNFFENNRLGKMVCQTQIYAIFFDWLGRIDDRHMHFRPPKQPNFLHLEGVL